MIESGKIMIDVFSNGKTIKTKPRISLYFVQFLQQFEAGRFEALLSEFLLLADLL